MNGMKPTIAQKWKVKALSEKIKNSDYPIPFVIVTESHLKPKHLAAEVHIEQYNVVRADRTTDKKNGGVAVYYNNSLVSNEISTYSDDYCQAVILYVKTLNLVIAGVYRPPNSKDTEVASFRACIDKIDSFIKKYPNSEFQMYGDLNFKYVDWETMTLKAGHGQKISEQICADILLNFMQKNLLSQHVSENTRKNKSLLDLVITNSPEIIHSVIVETTNLSDHDMITTRIINEKLTMQEKDPEYTPVNQFDRLNWNKAKWEEIRKDLSDINWQLTLENKDVDEICETINNKVSDIANKYCPTHKATSSKSFVPRERRSLIRTRKHINANINLLKYVKPAETKQQIESRDNKIIKLEKQKSEIEDKIKYSIETEDMRKEAEILEKIKLNPKAFYSYAQRKRKVKCKVGPLIDQNGNLQSDHKTMADILQKQYTKMFSEPTNPTEIDNEDANTNSDNATKLEDIEFSETDIIKAIDSMPNYSAPGPDKFPSIVLKQCKYELATPLRILWRQSLDEGQVPKSLKKQSIVPIYKKDSKAKPENYRPVSLTSHILKLFERVIREKLVEFIENETKLSNNQYGFRPRRSTISQLLAHIDRIICILERNKNADVMYLDFSKAFDKVCHVKLIQKLKSYNIGGKLLKWLENFLSERYQQVIVQGISSESGKVISGVPQGTVLGPILFILYINDITEVIRNASVMIFADDSKLIKDIENEDDRTKLIEDLKAVIAWAEENKMELNDTKFMLLQHGNKEDIKIPYQISENVTLEKSDFAKDLGILVDVDLKWRQQIATATTSATQLAGWALRVFRSRTKEVILTLFKALIRPKLEYGCVVWHPHLISDIAKLESVQRTLTSRIEHMENYNYWERLEKLDLFSMQRRRERYICIMMFKIYRDILPNNINLSFYESSRYGPKCKLKTLISRNSKINTLRCNSFSDIGAKLFNAIPKNTKAAKSVASFKSRLDKTLRSLPDQPPVPGYMRRNDNSIIDWLSQESGSSLGTTHTQQQNADDEITLLEEVEQPGLTQPTPRTS